MTRKNDRIPVGGHDARCHTPAARGELDGIRKQIPEDLLQPYRVPEHANPGRVAEFKRDSLLQRFRPQRVNRQGHD